MGGARDAGRSADAGESWASPVRQEGRRLAPYQPLRAPVLSVSDESAGGWWVYLTRMCSCNFFF